MGILKTWGGATWGSSVPVYITNKNADGYIMTYSVSMWMPILTMMLFFFNAILWGTFALVFFFVHLFGLIF